MDTLYTIFLPEPEDKISMVKDSVSRFILLRNVIPCDTSL